MASAIQQLRTTIGEALAGYIGQYTWRTGDTSEALDIRSDGEGRNAEVDGVSGLEVIIARDPIDQTIAFDQEGLNSTFPTWQVFLVAWDETTPVGFAAAKVAAAFRAVTIADASLPAGTGPLAQKILTIRSAQSFLPDDYLEGAAVFGLAGDDGWYIVDDDGFVLALL